MPRTKAPLFVFAALVVSAGVALFLFLNRPPHTSASGPGPRPNAVEPPAQGTERLAQEPAQPSAPERAQVAPQPPPPEPTPAVATLELRVEHAGEPVADAEILYVEEAAQWRGRGEEERLALASDPRTRSDANGRVEVPRAARRGFFVFARRDNLWGETLVSTRTEDGHVLVLAEDVHVEALLVDEFANPVADAPISMSSGSWEGRFVNPMTRTTGQDGIASFAHLQTRLSRSGDEPHAIVGLDYPLQEPVRASVDLRAPPSEPILLRLPPSGSVVLEFTDGAGPFQPGDALSVEFEAELAQSGREAHAPASRYVRDSSLRLPHVALGLRLRVSLESDECTAQAELLGPVAQGQEVRATVLVRVQPMLVGRLVDAQGAPLAGNWNAMYSATARFTSYRVGFETAADGVFRMPLPPVFEGEDHASFAIEPASLGFRFSGERDQGWVDLPLGLFEESGGEYNLGDVLVDGMPLLAAGVIVDGGGRPIEGAGVRVQHVTDSSIRESSLATQTASAADGSFEVRGHVPPLGLHLVAQHASHDSVRVPFRAGDTGLEISLSTMSVITGKVLLDESVPRERLMVTWVEHATGERSAMGGHIVLSEDGDLTLREIDPGPVSVSFRPLGASEPLERFEVDVEAGETERLPDVDLRDRLRLVAVSIQDEDGRPVQDAHVIVDPGAAPVGGREVPQAKVGLVHLVLQSGPVELAVHAEGFRPELVRVLDEDITVTMRRGLEIELEGDAGALPEPPLVLLPLLAPLDGESPDSTAPRAQRYRDARDDYTLLYGDPTRLGVQCSPMGVDAVASVRVPVPGRYLLVFEVLRDGERIGVRPAEPQVLTVEDSGSVQTFRVSW